MKISWKSVVAVLAGFFTGAILSVLTDVLLNVAGIMNMQSFKDNPVWLILIVIVYRFVYNVSGCYLTARLAPNHPMKHTLVIGVVGTILAIVGALLMWDKAVAWYNISIIISALPSAWLGAKLFMRKGFNVK